MDQEGTAQVDKQLPGRSPELAALYQSSIDLANFHDLPDLLDVQFDRKIYEQQGLGLTIARSLVELYAGAVHVQSKLGEGTRMFVRLPPGTGSGIGVRRRGQIVGHEKSVKITLLTG